MHDHFTLTTLPFAKVSEITRVNVPAPTCKRGTASARRNDFQGLDVPVNMSVKPAASMFSEILAPAAYAQFDLPHAWGAPEKVVFKYGRLLHGERGSCETRHTHAGSRDRMKLRSRTFGDPHQDRRLMTFSCNGELAEYAASAVVVRVESE